MFKKAFFMCVVAVLLQACGSSSIKDGAPNVTSSPSGAKVYANGQRLGTTPLRRNLFKVFPTGWSGGELSATGALIIKKTGCDDFIMQVNDGVLIKPIHAKLICKVKPMAIKEVPVSKQVVPVKMPKKKKMSKVEKRLVELEELHRNGVITDAEYKKTRKRILSEI